MENRSPVVRGSAWWGENNREFWGNKELSDYGGSSQNYTCVKTNRTVHQKKNKEFYYILQTNKGIKTLLTN